MRGLDPRIQGRGPPDNHRARRPDGRLEAGHDLTRFGQKVSALLWQLSAIVREA